MTSREVPGSEGGPGFSEHRLRIACIGLGSSSLAWGKVMLTRRDLIAAGAAAVAAPLCVARTHATTPANTIVMGKEIDDSVALDPAQAFEFTSIEVGSTSIAS